MKTLFKIFFVMAVVSLMASCNTTDDPVSNDSFLKKTHTVTVPFEANLLGELVSFDTTDLACTDEGYYGRVILDVTGNATHMGNVYTTFNFCAGGPDNPDIEGPDAKYSGSTCVLVAANGDELFLSLEGGWVIFGRTEDHPDYVVDYFRDTVNIEGGTGRFEGAEGKLQMDDYDTNIDEYSHHHWTGEITLVKGK